MQHYKTIIPATLGTALEWAEYTFFAYMANQLSLHFFPSENPELALFKTYTIFATSYFMRPLGAILLGTMGDKVGRKPALIFSMLLMCFATTAIGCLPGYSSIGTTATILLLLCRLLQGLAVAGEFNGAAVMMYEQHSKRPFFAGSLVPFSAAAGMSIGALAAMLVSIPDAPPFAWRIPFLASGLLGLVALYLRVSTTETYIPSTSTQANAPFLSLAIFKQYRNALISTAAMALFISVYIYIGSVYYKAVSIKLGNLNINTASQIIAIGQVLAALMILVFGLFADRMSGKKMCLAGLGLAVIFGPIILACAQSGDIGITFLGQCIYAIINGMVSAPMMTLIIKQFPANIRFRGNAFAWSIPSALFGGTALIVAETLLNRFGFMGPGLYISCASLVTFLIILDPKSLRQQISNPVLLNT